MVAKWPVCAIPNLGLQNLSNSGFACMGLPCARFSYVEHSYKFKAACRGCGSEFSALSACLWAPVETARLSPKIEESAALKLRPPDGPYFGVAVLQPRNLVPNCITRAGSICGPNFWGRKTAPFFWFRIWQTQLSCRCLGLCWLFLWIEVTLQALGS